MCRGRQRLQISSVALALRLELEAVVLDDLVGQQLLAHRLDALPRLVLGGHIEVHLDVLAHTNVRDLPEAKRDQALPDRDSLRVVDDRLRGHDHSCNHSLRALRGNSGFPTRRSYAVIYLSRVWATTSGGSAGGSDSLSHPERVSQSRTNCLSYESGDVPI